MRRILVTGGAGYQGCVLVPRLLEAGYEVVVYDLMLFGAEGLPRHPRLEIIAGDIRDLARYRGSLARVDAVIHLACISNDPSFELDPDLSRSMNFDCFEPLVVASRDAGVRRFIYVSTSSVYGVSDALEVTETHPLVPLTDYNRYKGLCEPLLLAHRSPGFTPVILRPATVCGVSPRMRFDLTVNLLTNHAVHRGVITVLGGGQKRPNVHVDDLAELYVKMLEYPDPLVAGETFNVGCRNQTVSDLALLVKGVVERELPEQAEIRIETRPTNDIRSYHVSSRKIEEQLGYRPRRTIEDAVRELCAAMKGGRFPGSMDDDRYVNVRAVKRLGLK